VVWFENATTTILNARMIYLQFEAPAYSLLRSHAMEPVKGKWNKRISHVPEVRTGQNEVHVFQAISRQEQLRWIQALAGQIVVRHESNYIEMAELIMCDEQEAHNRRLEESVCQVLDETGIRLTKLLGHECMEYYGSRLRNY